MECAQSQTPSFDSPQSVLQLGFEPIGISIASGHHGLRSQRSLLAELLAANTSADADEDEECDVDDCESEDLECASPAVAQRAAYCSCNVGWGVKRECHARECALASYVPAPQPVLESSPTLSSPIAIPTKTYFKSARQITERAQLQYRRQVYRTQMEAHEAAIHARSQVQARPQ